MTLQQVSDASWLEYVRTLWPMFVIITTAFGGAFGFWLRARFATKDDLVKLREDHGGKHSAHDSRIAKVEELVSAEPTRQAIMNDVGKLSNRISSVEATVDAGFDSVKRQLTTAQDYLQIIVEKGLK